MDCTDSTGPARLNINGAHCVETVGGCVFTVRLDGARIQIEDGQGNIATVTVADVKQSNGVIHVLDKVLLPAA